jgi:hypothetical protein
MSTCLAYNALALTPRTKKKKERYKKGKDSPRNKGFTDSRRSWSPNIHKEVDPNGSRDRLYENVTHPFLPSRKVCCPSC